MKESARAEQEARIKRRQIEAAKKVASEEDVAELEALSGPVNSRHRASRDLRRDEKIAEIMEKVGETPSKSPPPKSKKKAS